MTTTITISKRAYEVLAKQAREGDRTIISQVDLVLLGYTTTKGSGRPRKGARSTEGLLLRCPKCGKENYSLSVGTGRCYWCGYDANVEGYRRKKQSNKGEIKCES